MTTTAPTRHYRLLFWVLALVGLAADLGSKQAIFRWLGPDSPGVYRIWEATPETGFQLVAQFKWDDGKLVPHVNHGALFGIGNDQKSPANGVFLLISLVAAIALACWSFFAKGTAHFWFTFALGLILGGTLGNLHDRIVFGGVRDFLHWNYLFDWPVFNLADCWLVGGAGMLLIQALFFPDPEMTDPAKSVPQVAESAAKPVAAEPNPAT